MKCRGVQGTHEYRACIRCEGSCGGKLELNEGNALRTVTRRGRPAPRRPRCNRTTSILFTRINGHSFDTTHRILLNGSAFPNVSKHVLLRIRLASEWFSIIRRRFLTSAKTVPCEVEQSLFEYSTLIATGHDWNNLKTGSNGSNQRRRFRWTSVVQSLKSKFERHPFLSIVDDVIRA